MIRSMTGYGRATGSAADCDITVELRSVNHRYFDCNVRLPRMYLYLEDAIKTRVSEAVSRGKVDVFVTIEKKEGAAPKVSLNRATAEAYLDAIGELRDMKQLSGIRLEQILRVDLVDIAKLEGVLTVESNDASEDEMKAAVLGALDGAIASYLDMSRSEGARLETDILDRAATIEEAVGRVEQRSKECVSTYGDRLLAKLRETLDKFGVEADEGRVVTEAAIYADKVAVDEETVRLRSHIAELRKMLKAGGACGRKLDFLIQEFNREANTIGSKANDLEIAKEVVGLKSEIEKIREQVQNIE